MSLRGATTLARRVRNRRLPSALALSGLLLILASTAAGAAGTITPAYVATLGGPGHAAMYPSGMEIVPTNSTTETAGIAGNVVVADTGNDRVAEYTSSGTLVWQTNPSGVANEGNSAPCGSTPGFPQFEQPRDVGVDTSGNVYVADNGNNRIVVLNAQSGKCLVKPFKMSGAPIGVTVSTTPSGQIVLAANGTKSQILVFSTSGTLQRTISSTGACTINRARDAAADLSGDIYVANYESNDILEFSSSGACIRSWGTHGKQKTGAVCNGNGDGTFANPYGVAVGTDPFIDAGKPGEAIYVADSNDDCLQEFTPSGTWVAQVGSPGANTVAGTFTQLRRVAVDASGDIWGADLWGNRVEEFTPSDAGGVEKYTYAETIPNPVVPPGDTSTSIYNQVRGIAFDSSGDAVTMDTVNQRVVVFNSGDNLVGTCGQRGFTSTGDFNWPRGVAVDPVTGDYWIADTKQSDLQILEPLSEGCTGVAEFVKEGTAVGDLDYPYSIAIGGGYAWVADTKNNRIEFLERRHLHRGQGHLQRDQRLQPRHRVDTGRDRRRPDHRQRLRRPERQELLRRGRAERQRGHRARRRQDLHRAHRPLRGGRQRNLRRRRRERRPRQRGGAQRNQRQHGCNHHRERRHGRGTDVPLRPPERRLWAQRRPLHRRHLQRQGPGVLAHLTGERRSEMRSSAS